MFKRFLRYYQSGVRSWVGRLKFDRHFHSSRSCDVLFNSWVKSRCFLGAMHHIRIFDLA
jgi:hypothetical protein